MDKYLERLVKQLQEISEVVNAFDSQAVQLKVVEQLLPFIERNVKRNNVSPEDDDSVIEKKTKPISQLKEKKPGLKKTLIEFIHASFFDREKSIGEILAQLNQSGYEYKATQVSGILLGMVNEEILQRFQSPATNRYVYIKPILN